jgi:hypothetical protein
MTDKAYAKRPEYGERTGRDIELQVNAYKINIEKTVVCVVLCE